MIVKKNCFNMSTLFNPATNINNIINGKNYIVNFEIDTVCDNY